MNGDHFPDIEPAPPVGLSLTSELPQHKSNPVMTLRNPPRGPEQKRVRTCRAGVAARSFAGFCLLVTAFLTAAHAQVHEKVFSFTEAHAASLKSGGFDGGGLVRDGNVEFYGVTGIGGEGGASAHLQDDARRSANDTSQIPNWGNEGSFYGTTSGGGANGPGTVFTMTPP